MKHVVSEIVLNNGAKGLIINIPNATVMDFNFNFRAGEYLAIDKKSQVPHLMEHVVLGANNLIPKARDFQAELEKNGAYNNASTGIYDINYEAECADFEWERVFKLMLVAFSQPLFLDEEFKAEFGNVQEEMAARSNNHFRTLGLTMRKEFGLIGKTDVEHLNIMKNIKNEDLKKHYLETHFTSNMRFIIAGKITQKRLKTIKEMLESIKLPVGNGRLDLPDEIPTKMDKVVYMDNKTVKNLYFYLDTFHLERLNDKELDALNIVNVLLTETLYSKILGKAREMGLVYGMNSGISFTKNVTNWWFGTQVSTKNAIALMNIIRDEIDQIKCGNISLKDIKSTKSYALGKFQRSAQTVSGTVNSYAGRYFFDEYIEPYNELPNRIRKLTKNDFVTATSKMFNDGIWGVGVLGDCGDRFANKMKKSLAELWQ